jgi:ABC-type nitrate/sulfonate/bicarbonate transport system substrate-binding protein
MSFKSDPKRPPALALYRVGGGSVILAVALAVLAIAGCRQKAVEEPESGPSKITLAIQGAPYSGLIAVADEQGFFKKAGVEIKINTYPSGYDALKAMMRGEAQFATVADIAFATAMDEEESLRVIAAIGATAGSEIVARKDRNIREPGDLRGKRVGYSPGTSTAYFLHSFLLLNRISRDDITAIAIPSARQVEAVVSGEVDAVTAFEVYAFAARKRLGENAVAWEAQNTLEYQWLLVTKASPTQSPEAAKRLLKALILAEEFTVRHREQAKAIITGKWNIDPEFVHYSWNQTRLSVSFNQSIITALQSYGKWHTQNEKKTGTPPDVLTYLETGPLEALDPRLVTVFK